MTKTEEKLRRLARIEILLPMYIEPLELRLFMESASDDWWYERILVGRKFKKRADRILARLNGAFHPPTVTE